VGWGHRRGHGRVIMLFDSRHSHRPCRYCIDDKLTAPLSKQFCKVSGATVLPKDDQPDSPSLNADAVPNSGEATTMPKPSNEIAHLLSSPGSSHASTDATSDGRRQETRSIVIKSAKIVFEHSCLDCVVLDVSPGGVPTANPVSYLSCPSLENAAAWFCRASA
jgi:hypothetical protein